MRTTKTTARLPDDLMKRMDKYCTTHNVSKNDLIIAACYAYVSQPEEILLNYAIQCAADLRRKGQTFPSKTFLKLVSALETEVSIDGHD